MGKAEGEVRVGERVRFVSVNGIAVAAEVVRVYNPGLYPRGGVVDLRLQMAGPTDDLGGELPRLPSGIVLRDVPTEVVVRDAAGNVVRDANGREKVTTDRIALVDANGYVFKRVVAYDPKAVKSGRTGGWLYPEDAT